MRYPLSFTVIREDPAEAMGQAYQQALFYLLEMQQNFTNIPMVSVTHTCEYTEHGQSSAVVTLTIEINPVVLVWLRANPDQDPYLRLQHPHKDE